MLNARIRLGFLLAAVMFSFHATAATRFWELTNVRFDDGTIATGYFSYDDVAHEVTNWNVLVSEGPSFTAFNYLTGNSKIFASAQLVYFRSSVKEPNGKYRALELWPLTNLDGSKAVVSLAIYPDPGYSAEVFDDGFVVSSLRRVAAGSLVLMPAPPPIVYVQVDEFYNQNLRHYFITAGDADKHDLVTGVHPGWVRTGESFMAYDADVKTRAPINPVCRYYGDPSVGIDSHFFSADPAECDAVQVNFPTDWRIETDKAFNINLPDTVTGACPNGTIPVYRLWNRRIDSNHRYTTKVAIKEEMLGIGYVAEGYGPDRVAMCALR